MKKVGTLLFLCAVFFVSSISGVFAADLKTDYAKVNGTVENAVNAAKQGDVNKAKEIYDQFNDEWIAIEDQVKGVSKEAYGDIENKMGMVQFLFAQSPVKQDKLILALEDLEKANDLFIAGGYEGKKQEVDKNKEIKVSDLVTLLEKGKEQIQDNQIQEAVKTMDTFNSYWLEVEGVVLTQSKKVYDDAEKDMVTIKAYLTVDPIQPEKALKVMDRMHGYLTLMAGKTSYGIMDVLTIILREGLEALLVVVALLGILKKSGQENKKRWVYSGVGIGLGVSIVLAFLVKLLFASGTFGDNNFLIGGWSGVFAALMLIYVSYWLHSNAKVDERKKDLAEKSKQTMAGGGLFSLAFLAFLAVFREGTETVLFYIGMANSIPLKDLGIGILLGSAILIVLAYLVLKVGVKIPMKPFFLVSSLLVFYLALKFTGMGINGLQLAGILPATTSDLLPTISSLAVYPTWEGVIPQVLLIVIAIGTLLLDTLKIKRH